MKIKHALFSSTDDLKNKTRKEIRAYLWPLTVLEYMLAFIIPIFITIATYYREVETEFKISAVAYMVAGILLLMMYGRMKKGLVDWESNKRTKWVMLALIRFIPIVAVAFILYVININTEVFMDVINQVVIYYAGSILVGMLTNPLRTELKVRDKIRMNTETGRVID
jgi:archaellum biogenesis protein FlaJ (TadC family)